MTFIGKAKIYKSRKTAKSPSSRTKSAAAKKIQAAARKKAVSKRKKTTRTPSPIRRNLSRGSSVGSLYYGSNNNYGNFRQCRICDNTALTGSQFCLECNVLRESAKMRRRTKK